MQFSKALAENGITFVGPNADAIQAMGDKIESTKLAKKLGVSVIPGFDGEITDEKHLLQVGVLLIHFHRFIADTTAHSPPF